MAYLRSLRVSAGVMKAPTWYSTTGEANTIPTASAIFNAMKERLADTVDNESGWLHLYWSGHWRCRVGVG